MFGALSLLGIATGVANLGFLWFIIGSIISMVTTYFTILFLAETAAMSGCMTTESLATHYLGDAGKFVTQFFITIGNWFYMVNVMQIFADFIPSVISDWTDVPDDSFLSSRYFAVCVGVVLIVPWIGLKSISKLEALRPGAASEHHLSWGEDLCVATLLGTNA